MGLVKDTDVSMGASYVLWVATCGYTYRGDICSEYLIYLLICMEHNLWVHKQKVKEVRVHGFRVYELW